MPRIAPKPAPKPQLGARRVASGGIPLVACLFYICPVCCACVSSLSRLLPGTHWAKLKPQAQEVEDLEDQPSAMPGRKTWTRRVARGKNVRARLSRSQSLATAKEVAEVAEVVGQPPRKARAHAKVKAKAKAAQRVRQAVAPAVKESEKPRPKVRAPRRRAPKKARDKKEGRTRTKTRSVPR